MNALLLVAAVEAGISFNTAVNSIALAIVAGLTAYQTWRSSKQETLRNKKLAAIEESQKEIHTLVNSPYGIALEALAVAQETVAHMTKAEADLVRAKHARDQAEAHKAKQATADLVKATTEKLRNDSL